MPMKIQARSFRWLVLAGGLLALAALVYANLLPALVWFILLPWGVLLGDCLRQRSRETLTVAPTAPFCSLPPGSERPRGR